MLVAFQVVFVLNSFTFTFDSFKVFLCLNVLEHLFQTFSFSRSNYIKYFGPFMLHEMSS